MRLQAFRREFALFFARYNDRPHAFGGYLRQSVRPGHDLRLPDRGTPGTDTASVNHPGAANPGGLGPAESQATPQPLRCALRSGVIARGDFIQAKGAIKRFGIPPLIHRPQVRCPCLGRLASAHANRADQGRHIPEQLDGRHP
jgi:hypothetical protein